MPNSTSTAMGSRLGAGVYGESGRGYGGPRTAFDATVPAGVDPEGLWRFSNTDKYRRGGTTAAERAGAVPGYTPGYGRSAAGNTAGGLTPYGDWRNTFQPRANAPIDPNGKSGLDQFYTQSGRPEFSWDSDTWRGARPLGRQNPEIAAEAGNHSWSPGYPHAGTPIQPVTQPTETPIPIQRVTGDMGTTTSTVTGLPRGQFATATNVPGQAANDAYDLKVGRNREQITKPPKPVQPAATTRKPIDPLAS
jgi:hypothetical protein